MNGAEILVNTLLAGGVDVCFANPGTSEMHFVAALDSYPRMRCVLGLHECVVTGAADGYFRMAKKPASTLLHLGPGLANGLSNLHNAMKASSGIVNVVGDHASWHLQYDAPLTSDVDGIARPLSTWLKRARSADDVARHAAEAIDAARSKPPGIATLILPGDAAWNEAENPVHFPENLSGPGAGRAYLRPKSDAVYAAAKALLGGEPVALFLGGEALQGEALEAIGRIVAKTGAKPFSQTFSARIERGAGRASAARLPYPVDAAVEALKPFRHVITVQANPPVGFFAYPGKPSQLADPEAAIVSLCTLSEDPVAALEALAEAVGAARTEPRREIRRAQALPTGPLNPLTIAEALAVFIPENAVVVDESITTGLNSYALTAGAAPHDWLQNMGGSIGFAPPVATGAAIACPDRKVLCITGDGSAMYSLQALWTQAREGLDVTTLIFANRTYQILKTEFAGVGAGSPGPSALDMMDIDRPDLDWVRLGEGMGVPSVRVTTAEELCTALGRSLSCGGPSLIEVVL
nr:acetolactate synthase large subunit [uncultured Gellertiella sp.]